VELELGLAPYAHQPGNPRGRPKGSESFDRLDRRTFNERIAIRENGQRRTITKLQAGLKRLANKATAGDARAIKDVLKLQPVQAQQEGATDDNLTVKIVRFSHADPAPLQGISRIERVPVAPKQLAEPVGDHVSAEPSDSGRADSRLHPCGGSPQSVRHEQ
jgi:hypothetical protein